MKKYIFILCFILFNSLINVKAVCNSEDLSHLQELANNVTYKYEYTVEENKDNQDVNLIYKLNIFDMNEDLIFRYDKYNSVSVESLQNRKYYEGDKLQVSIYSYTESSCTNDLLRTITIDFPYYNDYYYYNKEKCQGNSGFKYCREFMDIGNKTFAEIDKLFEDYLKGDNTNNVNKDKNNFLNSYYIIWILSGTSIFVVFIIIVLIIRRKKKQDI